MSGGRNRSGARVEHDTRRRMLQLAYAVYSGHALSVRGIMEKFGVSLATAKRDMSLIEASLPVTATKEPHPSNMGARYLRLTRMDAAPAAAQLPPGPRVDGVPCW